MPRSYKEIDVAIFNLIKPVTFNFVINPLINIISSYFMGKKYGTVHLAGQSIGEQIIGFILSLISFLPLVLPPIITEHFIKQNNKKIIEYMNNAILFYIIVGTSISFFLFFYCNYVLNYFIINTNSVIFNYAKEYLRYRCLSIPIILINAVICSIFKGIMNFKPILKINFKSQILNLVLNYFLIQHYGIKGIAISRTIADLFCSISYFTLLKQKNMIKIEFINSVPNLLFLLKNGFFIQLKNIIGNITYFLINKKTIDLDNSGIITVTHNLSIKIYELLSILFLSINSISSIIISKNKSNHTLLYLTINRLLFWGFIISIIKLGSLFVYKSLINLISDDIYVIKELISIFPFILVNTILSGISIIMDGILQGINQYRIQSIFSLITMTIIYFSTDYIQSLSNIWFLLILISSIRIPIYFLFIRKKSVFE